MAVSNKRLSSSYLPRHPYQFLNLSKDALFSLLGVFFRALDTDFGLVSSSLLSAALLGRAPFLAVIRVFVRKIDLDVQAVPNPVDGAALGTNDMADVFLEDRKLRDVAVVALILFRFSDSLVDLVDDALNFGCRTANEDLVSFELLAARPEFHSNKLVFADDAE